MQATVANVGNGADTTGRINSYVVNERSSRGIDHQDSLVAGLHGAPHGRARLVDRRLSGQAPQCGVTKGPCRREARRWHRIFAGSDGTTHSVSNKEDRTVINGERYILIRLAGPP
jgi:hypothetical protein